MDMYISDTHFGHENILEECRPQFKTIDEMDSFLIESINQKMKKTDTLYIVGDFSFRSKRPVVEYLEAINPQKVLILGNHDRDWLKKLSEAEIRQHFLGIYPQYCTKKNKIELHFNHFPQLAWNRSHHFGGSFSICGHIHNARDTSDAARLFPLVKGQFNAGVDVNGFSPVTFEELVANNLAFYDFGYSAEEEFKIRQAVEKIMK